MSCGPCSWALNPFCRPPCELPGKQTCSLKAERHRTTCQHLQFQQCHEFRHVVLTTSISQASNYHFCPVFTCLLWKNGLRSFPLGTKPLCCPPGALLGKQTCSSKAERHCSTCKEFQDQQSHRLRPVVVTTLIPQGSNCHFCPIFTWYRKHALRSFPLGTKPLCLPRVSCSANKPLHQRLGRTARHAKSFNST